MSFSTINLLIEFLIDSETTIEQNEYFGHKNRMKSKQRGNNSISNLKDGQCIDILINDVSTTMGGMYRHRDSFSTWRNFTAGDVSFESSISSVPDRNRNKSKSPLFHELRYNKKRFPCEESLKYSITFYYLLEAVRWIVLGEVNRFFVILARI